MLNGANYNANMVLFTEYGAVCLPKNDKILMCFEGENNL